MSASDRLLPARIVWSLAIATIAEMLLRSLNSLDGQFHGHEDDPYSLIAQLALAGHTFTMGASGAVWLVALYAVALVWLDLLLTFTRRLRGR